MPLTEKDSLYLKKDLDILFVGLNPLSQSNTNGHYFSGKGSTFFKQLYESGLITENKDRSITDELVFGGKAFNYKNSKFGVIDLVPNVVGTSSNK